PGPSEAEQVETRNKILDGSIKLVEIPSRNAAKSRFAGQVIDLRNVRQEVIERVLDRLELDKNLARVIQRPRFLLALDNLSLSEFFFAYFVLCTRLAQNKNPGAERLTVQVPEPVMRAIHEPQSREALDQGLDFLLGDD